MGVKAFGGIGARVSVGSADPQIGFTNVSPPGFSAPPKDTLGNGVLLAGVGAAVWLAVLYVHWRQY